MAGFDFYVADNAVDRDDKAMVILKINHTELIEVNVWMYLDRVAEFCDFLRAEKPYLAAGTSANAPAMWEHDEGRLFLMIGADREMWEIALSFQGEERERLLSAFSGLGAA